MALGSSVTFWVADGAVVEVLGRRATAGGGYIKGEIGINIKQLTFSVRAGCIPLQHLNVTCRHVWQVLTHPQVAATDSGSGGCSHGMRHAWSTLLQQFQDARG